MQHRPGGLVARHAQHALQPQGAHALFLINGQISRRGQPHAQRRAGLIEDGSRGDRALVAAAAAR